MKTIQNTIVIVLLFIANAVAAQSFTKMSAQQAHLAGSGISAQAPMAGSGISAQVPSMTTPYANPILNRKVTVNAGQYTIGSARQNVSPMYVPVPRKAGAILPPKGTSGPAIWIGKDVNVNVGKDDIAGVGDLTIFTQDVTGTRTNQHDDRPGEMTPIGDALIPFLLMLLMYALFLLVRGDVRNEQEIME